MSTLINATLCNCAWNNVRHTHSCADRTHLSRQLCQKRVSSRNTKNCLRVRHDVTRRKSNKSAVCSGHRDCQNRLGSRDSLSAAWRQKLRGNVRGALGAIMENETVSYQGSSKFCNIVV